MLNVNKLKGKIVENGMTQRQLADRLGIEETTLNRKINNEGGEFLKLKEANQIVQILGISDATILKDIFFYHPVT